MKKALYLITILALLLPFTFTLSRRLVSAGELQIIAISPPPRSLAAATTAPISLTFNQPVNPATINSHTFWAFGKWSGTAAGSYNFTNGNQTVSLIPNRPFSAGEQVMVIVSHHVQAQDGSPMRQAGYSFQFWTAAAATDLQFEIIDTIEVRTLPNQSTRAYGGVATDFNGDGWLDLSIINEDSADVRVFLNKADGSGLFDPFLQPPTPVNWQASPNEPSDFNRDGHADIAIANISTNSITVLLGNGDGTFTSQEITVGTAPRGIAVLDVDGDGDIDIVNTNSGGSGNMSVLLNNGHGVFGPPTFFEGGANREWGLAAADMNEDGILDLVIGTYATPSYILIQTGNGDGTFTLSHTQSAGGPVWMLNASDVNGDGHEDVAVANSGSNTGSILLGNGDGTAAAPTSFPTDVYTIATDLGDIDGDGDLDWVTSSFSGDWQLFLNDGSGHFTLHHAFTSPENASCAILFDFDNDGDLDLALIDETADKVILVRNNNLPGPGEAIYMPYMRR
ncbi:MAG: VCBS repeat-containing protein [Anaerolineae bacterium]|nr:VCBS repeat-containing protein [Anaerolineae bacterium]